MVQCLWRVPGWRKLTYWGLLKNHITSNHSSFLLLFLLFFCRVNPWIPSSGFVAEPGPRFLGTDGWYNCIHTHPWSLTGQKICKKYTLVNSQRIWLFCSTMAGPEQRTRSCYFHMTCIHNRGFRVEPKPTTCKGWFASRNPDFLYLQCWKWQVHGDLIMLFVFQYLSRCQ